MAIPFPTINWSPASPGTISTSRTASPTGRGGRCRPAQLNYAVSDVTHLRDVYLKLSADLDKQGRTDWMREEMKVLTSAETYRSEPQHAWERLKTRVRKPRELAVLMEVAAWREQEAQSRDVPRGRVLKERAIRAARGPT